MRMRAQQSWLFGRAWLDARDVLDALELAATIIEADNPGGAAAFRYMAEEIETSLAAGGMKP